MSRLARDGMAEAVSRDHILRRERRQGNIRFPCSADNEQNWQPYPIDIFSATAYMMTKHTYKVISVVGVLNLHRSSTKKENLTHEPRVEMG